VSSLPDPSFPCLAGAVNVTRLAHGDETKNALKRTEFFAMVAVNAAILIAA
jgi:hypothetical protein